VTKVSGTVQRNILQDVVHHFCPVAAEAENKNGIITNFD